jgi:hypothetical protein
MNTTAPTTDGTRIFRSPLQVTREAVRLRGWRYPLTEVKAANVVPVPVNKGGWEWGITIFDFFCASRIGDFAVEIRLWERKASDSQLVTLLGAIGAYLLVAYLLRYLYDHARKKWRYIYAVGLDTGYGRTLVAASHDRTYIANIVVEISSAIAAHRGRKVQAQEPVITYDNYFYIDNRYLTVPGWSAPLTDIKYAARATLEEESYLVRFWSIFPIGLLLASFAFKTMLELGDSWFTGVVVALALTVSLALIVGGKRRKDKAEMLTRVYVANVGTTLDVFPVLISADKDYVDRFVSVVNETVRERDRQVRKRSKATVGSSL